MGIHFFIALIFILSYCEIFVEACRDDGLTYRNGEEWEKNEEYVMRCTIFDNGSWKIEVVACVFKQNGLRIPINKSIKIGNNEFKCKMKKKENSTLTPLNTDSKCNGKSVGSKWLSKSFELECRPDGIRLVACISNTGQRFPANGPKENKGFTVLCQETANKTMIFHYTKTVKSANKFPLNLNSNSDINSIGNTKCDDENGNKRNIGDYWIENFRFNKTCKSNGAVEVVNCISKDGYRIPLNGQLIREKTKYSCDMTTQGTIRFAAEPTD